jgi:enoyl-CoA hydratase
MAADNVRIGSPEIRLGLFPAAGGSQRITRLCGPAVAAQIIYTGDRIDAATARQWNLIHWCVPAAELGSLARERVEQIAAYSPDALRAAKTCIAAQAAGRPDGFALERELGSGLIATEQTRTQVLAFLSKQK